MRDGARQERRDGVCGLTGLTEQIRPAALSLLSMANKEQRAILIGSVAEWNKFWNGKLGRSHVTSVARTSPRTSRHGRSLEFAIRRCASPALRKLVGS